MRPEPVGVGCPQWDLGRRDLSRIRWRRFRGSTVGSHDDGSFSHDKAVADGSIARLLAAAVIAAGGVVKVPASAEAGGHGCVSQREYRQAHHGMRKKRIHRSSIQVVADGAPGYLLLYRNNGRLRHKGHMVSD